MAEKILALPRAYLFGLAEEYLWDGFVSYDPALTSSKGVELGEEVEMREMYRSNTPLGWLFLPQEQDGISPNHLAHVSLVEMPGKDSLVVQPGELAKSENPRWMSLEEIEDELLAPWSRVLVPILKKLL